MNARLKVFDIRKHPPISKRHIRVKGFRAHSGDAAITYFP